MSTRLSPTRGPGPSRRTSSPVRRSTTTRTPSSSTRRATSPGESPWRLSARISTPGAVAPPRVSGSPPRSRTLTAPPRSTQALRRSPLPQDVGNDHAAVLGLVRLHQRDQRPADRHGGAVQRVHVLGFAAPGPVADVEPAGLEIGRVGGRGELAV